MDKWKVWKAFMRLFRDRLSLNLTERIIFRVFPDYGDRCRAWKVRHEVWAEKYGLRR